MPISKRLAQISAALALLVWHGAGLEARTRKGDHFYAQGRVAEQSREWDKAFEFYEQALAEDPSDVGYQMAYRRARFQAGQAQVEQAKKLRDEGNLEGALDKYQRAAAIDPASPVAVQEMRRTMQMIEERDRRKAAGEAPEGRPLAPGEGARRQIEEKLEAVMSMPELRPLSPLPHSLRINNQTPRVMYETVTKLAGINVLFDQDFNTAVPQATTPRSLELVNVTLEDALNYIALMTRSFWKPVTSNTIFITADNPQKRNEFEEQVAKIVYLNNMGADKDLGEVVAGLRQLVPTLRMAPVTSLNALIIRGTADQVALAEMMLRNLDRPKAEVVVDVIVMEASRSRSRDLTLGLLSGNQHGINIAAGLTARSTGAGDGAGGGSGAGTAAPTSSVTMNRLDKLSSRDFSVTLPGAALEALMSDRNARILQSPQVRAIDNMKASLRIGDKVPYSTGGMQPLLGTVGAGASSLYSQFQFLDVGVNVDITPKIHGDDEVTLHVELEISSVKERIDIGGISQPVVGQRRVVHDIRLREGEVNLLGGLVQETENKSVSGIPGLSSIPVVRRLFSSETVERSEAELLIALVPRIVRTPELDDLAYKGIASGNLNTVRLTYASRPVEPAEPSGTKPQAAPPAGLPSAAPEPAAPAVPAAPEAKPAAPAPPPAGAARVLLSPDRMITQPGATFTVNLQVENVTDLFSAPVRLKFDPNVVRLSEVTRGSLLTADGGEVLFTRNILNDTGDASIVLSRMPGSPGVSGSGSLLTLTFQVVGKGVTAITAPQLSFQDSRASTIVTASPQVSVSIE